jgi:hypothetical protein
MSPRLKRVCIIAGILKKLTSFQKFPQMNFYSDQALNVFCRFVRLCVCAADTVFSVGGAARTRGHTPTFFSPFRTHREGGNVGTQSNPQFLLVSLNKTAMDVLARSLLCKTGVNNKEQERGFNNKS